MARPHRTTQAILALVLLASDQHAPIMSVQTANSITASYGPLIEDNLINDLHNLDSERIPLVVSTEQPSASNYQDSSCRLVPIVHLLKHPGCQPKPISSYACSGSCPSFVKTSTSRLWQLERSCSCCQLTGSQETISTLDCPSLEPPFRKVKTHAPVNCLCRSCTDLGREDLRPQELVEALANEAPRAAGIATQE